MVLPRLEVPKAETGSFSRARDNNVHGHHVLGEKEETETHGLVGRRRGPDCVRDFGPQKGSGWGRSRVPWHGRRAVWWWGAAASAGAGGLCVGGGGKLPRTQGLLSVKSGCDDWNIYF